MLDVMLMLMLKISSMLLWSLCKNGKDEGSVADSLKKRCELAVNNAVTVGASMMFGIGFSLIAMMSMILMI